MRFKHLITGTASALALGGVAFGGAAYAQAASDQAAPLSELIVTAQKREQWLQRRDL